MGLTLENYTEHIIYNSLCITWRTGVLLYLFLACALEQRALCYKSSFLRAFHVNPSREVIFF